VESFRLDDKTVLITGASSGFGHHFAGVLAEAGARVVLGARRMDKVRARVEEINAAGGQAMGATLDVLDTSSIDAFFDAAGKAYGLADVVINNAGVESGAKTYAMITEEDWDAVIDTNLKAPWLVSKLYTERVAASGRGSGNIINIASITAFRTIKGQFPYTVSKAALVKATEVMALEGARFGIRVNALAPGYILTDVSRLLLESERSERFENSIPMRRYGQFDDLDGPLLLLASDASRYMTGSTVVVDGGHVCAELG
jgi:NAD(P)-dependent dehydrogenase (short-subunit alcohol dehydrogenase family)